MDRPWVTPKQVKDYTDSDKVIARSDTKLSIDITRAESYVIYHTHNDFSDEAYKDSIPAQVSTAIILLAEAYALKSIGQTTGTKSSETFDDYSYTIDVSEDEVEKLGIGPMLDPYVIEKTSGRAFMRLRKL